MKKSSNRRKFLKETVLSSAALLGAPILSNANITNNDQEGLYMIGPRQGYSPRVGTLLSTMEMMREWVVGTVKDLSVEQLDYRIDQDANSIGAMLLHLAATEKYYQLNTFDELKWGTWGDDIKAEWDLPMSLGPDAAEKIKGNEVSYYIEKLEEVRAVTRTEFAKRDDEWLMKSEAFFANEPTNNHCKWFHVCEHESNHRGQMKFIIKRLPS